MIAAFLTILTVCGDPVYIIGHSEDGRLLAGEPKFVYSIDGGGQLMLDIIDQLPEDKDGNPIVGTKELEYQCPTHSA